MGSRTRVTKLGQNVRQLAQCFHTSDPIQHNIKANNLIGQLNTYTPSREMQSDWSSKHLLTS